MFVFAIALAIFAGFIYYLMKNYGFWQARGVSFPKPAMFFGNFRESMMRKRHIADDFSQFY
jgi:cytochrome P450 family 6